MWDSAIILWSIIEYSGGILEVNFGQINLAEFLNE